jgi:hypothetical protein
MVDKKTELDIPVFEKFAPIYSFVSGGETCPTRDLECDALTLKVPMRLAQNFRVTSASDYLLDWLSMIESAYSGTRHKNLGIYDLYEMPNKQGSSILLRGIDLGRVRLESMYEEDSGTTRNHSRFCSHVKVPRSELDQQITLREYAQFRMFMDAWQRGIGDFHSEVLEQSGLTLF